MFDFYGEDGCCLTCSDAQRGCLCRACRCRRCEHYEEGFEKGYCSIARSSSSNSYDDPICRVTIIPYAGYDEGQEEIILEFEGLSKSDFTKVKDICKKHRFYFHTKSKTWRRTLHGTKTEQVLDEIKPIAPIKWCQRRQWHDE